MDPHDPYRWNPWTGRYERYVSSPLPPPSMRFHSARAARLSHRDEGEVKDRRAYRRKRKARRKQAQQSRRRNR